MAKGQIRSNREKKPKQAKAKPAGAASQFSALQPKSTTTSSSGKNQ